MSAAEIRALDASYARMEKNASATERSTWTLAWLSLLCAPLLVGALILSLTRGRLAPLLPAHATVASCAAILGTGIATVVVFVAFAAFLFATCEGARTRRTRALATRELLEDEAGARVAEALAEEEKAALASELSSDVVPSLPQRRL